MSDRFTDNVSRICAEFLNEVDDILIALCNASTTEEIRTCLDMLTSSQLAQAYTALDGSNRMTGQLSLQGDAPVEDFHAAPKSWIDAQIAAVNQLIGFARRDETQVAHNFTAGQPVYWDGIEWKLAIATGLATAGTHVVAFVADADNFQVSQFGWIENLPPSTLTPGAISYVSDTVAGELTLTEPAFSNPILLGISDTLGWAISQRAIPSGGLDFAIQSDYDTGEEGKSVDPALGNENYLTKSATGNDGQDQVVQLPVTLNELKGTEVRGATNTITVRTSTTPSEVPTLVEGEAELNIPDEILHVGDNVGGTIPFNKNPAAAPVEHADTLNRDAVDSHPVGAITGLQSDLDGRYTSAEVDGLIAGLQSQIDTQQDTIDLQPLLVAEYDMAGVNPFTDPIDAPLETGYDYELRMSSIDRPNNAASATMSLQIETTTGLVTTGYNQALMRYQSGDDTVLGAESTGNPSWSVHSPAWNSGYSALVQLFFRQGITRASYLSRTQGYALSPAATMVQMYQGTIYVGTGDIISLRILSSINAGAYAGGIVQLYRLPKLATP